MKVHEKCINDVVSVCVWVDGWMYSNGQNVDDNEHSLLYHIISVYINI